MTYSIIKKVIDNNKNIMVEEEWKRFVQDITKKLDIFLLNSRITEEQYNELLKILY